MKKLVIAGLLITTLLLILLSGCKIGGKAIQLPNVTATDIANFPYQFLTSTASTIGYSTTTIFAPAAYSTQVTDLMNFMRQKACQLAISQGYGCVDSQGNPLTGGAVFSLTGMSVAGQAVPDTTPIYRCWLNAHGVIDHFLSKDPNCGGPYTSDGLIGYLYQTNATGRVAIHQCHRQQRYESNTYTDKFAFIDGCPAGADSEEVLGYAPANATSDTKTLYQCRRGDDDVRNGNFDHMLSASVSCEGYFNLGEEFYFLQEAKVALPPYDNGHMCAVDTDCKSNYCTPDTKICAPQATPMYRCWLNAHGVMDHFLSKDSCPSGSASDGLIGYLIAPQKPNAVAIHNCYRQQRYESNTYTDRFTSIDGCPAGATSDGIFGYALPQATNDTKTLYQCRRGNDDIRNGNFDHMLSESIGCEGYMNVGEEFYFLKTDVVPAVISAPVQEATKLLYRCYNTQRWDQEQLLDHYVSYDPNCESNHVDGPIGYVYQQNTSNTEAIYQCHRQSRHSGYTWTDHFVSKDANCEGQAVDLLVGYLPVSAYQNTTKYYRCLGTETFGGFDHLISSQIPCEGYINEGIEFNFLNTATPTGAPPIPPTLSGPGGACTQTSNCQTGYECITGYCTVRRSLYACDGGFPSTYADCTDPNTGDSGTGRLIGYGLETSISIPGTSQFGYCTDEYGFMADLAFMETSIPCSRGFNSVVRVFNSQITGTVQLVLCSDYNNNYIIRSASATCPTGYPIGGAAGKYIFPEPYCGDGNVVSPEQCEPSNTVTCNANCQNIIIPPPPANITNVTNYTYIPPTTGTPPTTTPITITTNYIAIGTCTDNLIISDNTYGIGMTACSNLMPGEAIIQLKQVGTIIGLIVAGGSPADVNPAIQVLKNLTKWSAEGARLDITNNTYLTTVGRLSSTAGAWRYNMEYRLPAGIHFIGVPFSIASKTIANNPAILSAAGGIFAYDATNNRSVKFDVDWPASPPLLSDLTTFGNELEAYYVKTSTARTFMMPDASRATTMTRNIPAAGWVAYTSYGKQKTLSQIIPVGVTVNSLWCYENNQFVQKNLALNPTIDVGQGCWINLASGATLS